MIKDPVIQFVCFVTKLEPDQFIAEWEPYAKKLHPKKQEPNLLELVGTAKNKFRYVSQHQWHGADFNFAFMNKSRTENFPEHNIKVVQVGGYILTSGKKYAEKDGDVKMIAFLSHNETDIDFYRRLPRFQHLDIYQAYYESCTYGYILEFCVAEADADELLGQLQQRHGVESGIYKECSVTA